MSILSIATALFLTALAPFYTVQKRSVQYTVSPNQHKAIIFDLGGVVIDTCKKNTLWQIGPRYIFDYMRTCRTIADLRKTRNRFFDLMHHAAQRPQKDNQWGIKDDLGKHAPQLMAEWLRGAKPNKEILTQITHWAHENPDWFSSPAEQWLLTRIATITFTPHLFLKTRKIFPESVDLIKECKQKGFKLYVLSNWDRESGKLLVEQNPETFGLFDGIVFSGDAQCAKPEPEIFSCITDSIPADECIFIDDQPENIATARRLGFKAIHVKNKHGIFGATPNITSVHEDLTRILAQS